MNEAIQMYGTYELRHSRRGTILGEYRIKNGLTSASKFDFAASSFGGFPRAPVPYSPSPDWYFSYKYVASPTGRVSGTENQVFLNGVTFDWYIGLCSSSSPDVLDQLLTFTGFTEALNYSGQRKQWIRKLTATNQVSNVANPAVFTFNNPGTLTGAFLCISPYVDYDGAAYLATALNGTRTPRYSDLWGGALFNTPLSVLTGDTLDVIYAVQL